MKSKKFSSCADQFGLFIRLLVDSENNFQPKKLNGRKLNNRVKFFEKLSRFCVTAARVSWLATSTIEISKGFSRMWQKANSSSHKLA
jgi:hypothetical protein